MEMKQLAANIFFGILLILAGFWLGSIGFSIEKRNVEFSNMEKCLAFYKDFRANNDQGKLHENLSKIGLTPKDFQIIIDRFIYYRTRKSSMKQAMNLLQAFRMGYDIKPEKIVSISTSSPASAPFSLDAEILSVFEKKPDLVKDAFEG